MRRRTWPGQARDEIAAAEAAADRGCRGRGPGGRGSPTAEAPRLRLRRPRLAAAEPESADLPLWDWSPPAEPSRVTEEPPAAEAADPPRPEWKPVVTPVEEAGEEPRPPGIGQRRGNLAHLSANPRMRVWRLRIVVAVIVMVAFSILVSWQFGLTLAVLAVIADTIYRSRRDYAGTARSG